MSSRQTRILPANKDLDKELSKDKWLNVVLKNGSTHVLKVRSISENKIDWINLRGKPYTLLLSEIEEIWQDQIEPAIVND